MLPIRDTIPSQHTPWVNYALIGVTSLVFYLQVTAQQSGADLIEKFGMIPARVWRPDAPLERVEMAKFDTPMGPTVREVRRPMADSAVPAWLTPLTCIFLHGGLMHLVGNMWFLFIFGDNLEDRLGHVGYLAFYLACGVMASIAHLITAGDSAIPTVGASGAIAGVMGGYFFLYPRSHVLTVVPIFIFLQLMELPAAIFLGIWFVLQFLQGVATAAGPGAAGVAWWAHIGGFVVGLGAVALLYTSGLLGPPPSRAAELATWQGHVDRD